MANGANRLFSVIKKTSKKTQPVSTQMMYLIVKSKSPLTLKRDDKLELTEEFLTFMDNSMKEDLEVDDVVSCILLNDGQRYLVLPKDSSSDMKAMQKTLLNLVSRVEKIEKKLE